jgi:hypothetical protein
MIPAPLAKEKACEIFHKFSESFTTDCNGNLIPFPLFLWYDIYLCDIMARYGNDL